MNKIEELKRECKVERYWDTDKQIWVESHVDLNLFASKIIQESTRAIELEVNNWRQLAPFNEIIKQRGVQAIKNHFGVT